MRGFSVAVCVAWSCFFPSIICDAPATLRKSWYFFEQQPRLNSTLAESLASALQLPRYLQGPRRNRLIHSVELLRPAVVGGWDSPVLIASISRKYLSGSVSLSCAIAASPLALLRPYRGEKPKRTLIRVKLPKGQQRERGLVSLGSLALGAQLLPSCVVGPHSAQPLRPEARPAPCLAQL